MTDEKPMHGIFSCPMPNCYCAIIGDYNDLYEHVVDHEFSDVAVIDEETGETVEAAVKRERDAAFEKLVQQRLVADGGDHAE